MRGFIDCDCPHDSVSAFNPCSIIADNVAVLEPRKCSDLFEEGFDLCCPTCQPFSQALRAQGNFLDSVIAVVDKVFDMVHGSKATFPESLHLSKLSLVPMEAKSRF